MRQALTIDDEPYLIMRSMSVDYVAGGDEELHTHRWPQILYAIEGAIRADVADMIWVIPPRRGLIIPAECQHKLRMLGMVKLRTLYCSPRLQLDVGATRVFNVCGLLHEAILRSCQLMWLDKRVAADLRLADLIADEIKTAESASFSLTLPRDLRARRLAAGFADIKMAHRDLCDLYFEANVSRRTAERLFIHETGLSPARWRRHALLSLGLEYLTAGKSVEQVADLVGYRSQPAFTEAFKKTFGFPPNATQRSKKRN